MVTKTISFTDELYDQIREIAQKDEMKYSSTVARLCKLGIAYSTLLEEQKTKSKKDKE